MFLLFMCFPLAHSYFSDYRQDILGVLGLFCQFWSVVILATLQGLFIYLLHPVFLLILSYKNKTKTGKKHFYCLFSKGKAMPIIFNGASSSYPGPLQQHTDEVSFTDRFPRLHVFTTESINLEWTLRRGWDKLKDMQESDEGKQVQTREEDIVGCNWGKKLNKTVKRQKGSS